MLAGYISGNTVDLARVREVDGAPKLYNQASFSSKDFSNFDSILRVYLKKNKGEIPCACFGVAGPVIDNEVRTTNLPWYINAKDIQKKYNVAHVRLLNDIVALAYGLPQLSEDRFFMINEGKKQERGNIGLIAAGSGLGEALIHIADGQHFPYASEGGHADFAPGSQLEIELWEYLYSDLGHIEVEDIISLRGLERIYNFVVDTQGKPAASWYEKSMDRPSTIVEKALSGKDEDAMRTLDIFIDCYASEASNLALKGMTLGGIFIGGVIGPQIITILDKGRFLERFIKKGKMEALLARIPVGIIIEERTPLIGAAAVALRGHALV